MLLERTISQLDIGYVPDNVAEELGHLGYAQWLGALKGNAGYLVEAMRAYDLAKPFIRTSPAVAVFCQLLVDSVASSSDFASLVQFVVVSFAFLAFLLQILTEFVLVP